jgi:succinate dehydrogenase / fumarate reductase iron-sulfur subunit
VRDGHLPVTELLSDRPGANSPFGDDQAFPLPPSALVYRHPTPKS